MARLFLLVIALLLPLQSAWSAASAYCQHEATAQSRHVGHHFHAHEGEAKPATGSQLMADADCTACHAGGAAALPTGLDGPAFAATSPTAELLAAPPFTSALARAPDRPQWLRLV